VGPRNLSQKFALAVFWTGCSAAASALGSGPRGRRFESSHPDQETVPARPGNDHGNVAMFFLKGFWVVRSFGAWRSPVAQLHGVQKVAGSNPAAPTIFRIDPPLFLTDLLKIRSPNSVLLFSVPLFLKKSKISAFLSKN
jgi:hypothetical protein